MNGQLDFVKMRRSNEDDVLWNKGLMAPFIFMMLFFFFCASITDADARIRCRKDMQIVNGQFIATPYCEDQYLAKVARQYGTRTSAARIRNNPNHKKEVCRLVRHDIRVQETCQRILPSRHGR